MNSIGKLIGLRNIKTNAMMFIKLHENIKEITAMSLSPNFWFFVVCEKHKLDHNAYLSFYDIKKDNERKSLSIKQIKSSINITEIV